MKRVFDMVFALSLAALIVLSISAGAPRTARSAPVNFDDTKISLSEEAAFILEEADEIQLLSISPCNEVKLKPRDQAKPEPDDKFGGCPVLKKTSIKDPLTKKNIIIGLYRSVMYPQTQARCFSPRHGIRAKYKDYTVELLICFECGNYTGLLDGGAAGSENFGGAIGDTSQELFNGILAAKGVRTDKP